jgi:hypothetical protein
MPVTCYTAAAPTLVRYAFDGNWAAPDFLQRRRELIRTGQLTSKTAVLFDLRHATTFPPLDDLHPARHTSASDAIWPVCRAFLVNTEAQYDAARRLQALLGPQSVVNEIFQDETKALEWLSAMAERVHAARA